MLKTIQRMGAVSRVDLAKASGLSRPTVTRIVGELLDLGVLVEEAVVRPGRDDPRAMLRLNAEWGRVVAISVVFNLSVAVANLKGELVAHETVVKNLDSICAERLGAPFEEVLRGKIGQVLAQWADSNVIGIGAAVGGVVDNGGVVRLYDRVGLKNFDLQQTLLPVTVLPVLTDTETRLYLRYTLLHPEHAQLRNVVALAPHVSGDPGPVAMYLDGRFFSGSNGMAGLGYLADRRGAEVPDPNRFRERIARFGGEKAYIETIKAGDPEATEIYETVIESYARQIALVANLLNPEAVFLYTAYNGIGGRMLEDIRRATAPHLEPFNAENFGIYLGGPRCDRTRLEAAATAVVTRFFEVGELERSAVGTGIASTTG